MSVRCPSCGSDSPDTASWCDFCKEPFKKKAPAPAPAAPSQPKLSQEELLARVPAELIPSEDEEKIPAVPKWVRLCAWIFLGIWFIWGMILTGILYGRYKLRQAEAHSARP